MGARQVRHHGGGNVIGTFAGLKARSQPYESTIERDLMYFAECDPQVVTYQSQPFTITETSREGETHNYTPDNRIIRHHDRILVECKRAAEIDSEDTQRQCRIGRSSAEEHDHVFLLVTDDILRRGPCLDNLKKMWRYSRFQVSALTTRQYVALLAEYPEGLSFLDLATILADGQSPPLMQSPLIYALLFQQTLVTDLTSR